MTLQADPELASICDTVQHNCAISDARYARNYSLCIYLLRMREFYRWRYDLALNEPLSIESVGEWISDTEEAWDAIEENDFEPLIINGRDVDPFDSHTINCAVNDDGLIYSAGYGRMGQPHFLLATLNKKNSIRDTTCFDCGSELARDTITMPAMAQGNSIFIRQDSICRLIWQMFDEWTLHKKSGAMARLVKHYMLDKEPPDIAQLESIASELSWVIREHELGEVAAGEVLGAEFQQMACGCIGGPGEYLIRAVRDMLADTLYTWPGIVRRGAAHYLDFWLAGVNGVREQWLTQTGMLSWLNIEDQDTQLSRLTQVRESERDRWLVVAQSLVSEYRREGPNLAIDRTIAKALEQSC